VDWVAVPPESYPGHQPNRAMPSRPPRYTGPPSYPVPPRWGFPLVTWRPPTSLEPVPASPPQRVRALAGTAVPLLWLAAVVSLLAAAAELWRYVLLLDSRYDALPAGLLRLSDALVVTGGVVAVLACGLAGLVTLFWVLRAYVAAADAAGVRPSRSTAVVAAGWLVPGANLLVPGSSLAEIEHGALRRPPRSRPTPSRLLRAWWLAWALGVVLAGLTVAWSFRDGTQAMADGVLLHAAVDGVAAVVAALTAVVVRSLTRLLLPVVPGRVRRMHVVQVKAPSPPDRPGRLGGGDRQRVQAADGELGAADRLAGQAQAG
jgi:hypothetical protein